MNVFFSISLCILVRIISFHLFMSRRFIYCCSAVHYVTMFVYMYLITEHLTTVKHHPTPYTPPPHKKALCGI